ncbi:MAG: hypothetical protein HS130_04290 [Deltaproteobacteria bacterium]|nr:hypothetical protein [Deltaproteobacteria bacterium]MCL4873354.1 hypothetical protein [bacterium]
MGRENLLVLLEDKGQFLEYEKAGPEYASLRHAILALTPQAIEICASRGLKFITPEECFSEEEYYRQKKVSEKEIQGMVSALDRRYARLSEYEVGFPLEMGRYFYLLLYLLAGALHLRAFVLERAIARFDPGLILAFMPRSAEKENGKAERHRPYAELLLNSPYAGRCRAIEYDPAQPPASIQERLKGAAVEAIGRFPALSSYYALKRNGLSAGRKPRGGNILILGPVYNWKSVLSHPMLKDRAGLFWIPREQAGPRKILRKEGAGQLCDCRFLGFDLNRALSGFFSAAQSTFDELLETHDDVARMVKRADMVLVSVFASPRLNHAAHVASSMGKPVIVYQHGEQNLWDNSLFPEATELLYADHYLSFGDGVTGKYLEAVGEGKLKGARSIGSAALESIPGGDAKSGYILYATGKYHLYSTPFISTIGQDTRLYNAQKNILGFLTSLARAGGPRAVFKRNNTANHNELPFEVDKAIDEARPDEKFTSLLSGASLVILDAPATTCLEACATRKPLFVLLDRVKWNEEPERLLKRRAVAAYTPDDLIMRIEEYLKTGEYGADLDDREFVRAYGTHLDDGKSAERAAGFVLKLLDERQRAGVLPRRGAGSLA